VFPARYELNIYILFRRDSVFRGLNTEDYFSIRFPSQCFKCNMLPVLRYELLSKHNFRHILKPCNL
jgi:hypothetical protein